MKTTMMLAMSATIGIFMLMAAPSVASAQTEDISQKQIPSLELDQADVREALRALFKNVNVSYSIAPEVQGTVTVSLKNVAFDTALQNILRQVDATYRVEAGVYEIIKRDVDVAPTTGTTDETKVTTTIVRRIKVRSADPEYIAAMLGAKRGNQNYTSVSPEMSTIARGNQLGGMGGGMGGMGGGMGGMMGGMGGGMMGGMGGGMMGGMGGGMMGGMGGGMMGGGGFGGGGYGGGMGGGMGGGYGGGRGFGGY